MLRLRFWKESLSTSLITTLKLYNSAREGRRWRNIGNKLFKSWGIPTERMEKNSKLLKVTRKYFSSTKIIRKSSAREALYFWSEESTKMQLGSSIRRSRSTQAIHQLCLEGGRHMNRLVSPCYRYRTTRPQLRSTKNIYFALQPSSQWISINRGQAVLKRCYLSSWRFGRYRRPNKSITCPSWREKPFHNPSMNSGRNRKRKNKIIWAISYKNRLWLGYLFSTYHSPNCKLNLKPWKTRIPNKKRRLINNNSTNSDSLLSVSFM